MSALNSFTKDPESRPLMVFLFLQRTVVKYQRVRFTCRVPVERRRRGGAGQRRAAQPSGGTRPGGDQGGRRGLLRGPAGGAAHPEAGVRDSRGSTTR